MWKLHRLLRRAWARTSAFWPEREVVSEGLEEAVQLLNNESQQDVQTVKQRSLTWLKQMRRQARSSPWLRQVVAHFCKVTRSDGSYLFHGDEGVELPRTHNDLEQRFGATRHHERRATGRQSAGATWVVVGSVRLAAALASRLKPFTAVDWVPRDLSQWHAIRAQLSRCQPARACGKRFRRNPDKSLAQLEEKMLKLSLRS